MFIEGVGIDAGALEKSLSGGIDGVEEEKVLGLVAEERDNCRFLEIRCSSVSVVLSLRAGIVMLSPCK